MKEALSILFAGFVAATIFFGGIILFVKLTDDKQEKPKTSVVAEQPTGKAAKPKSKSVAASTTHQSQNAPTGDIDDFSPTSDEPVDAPQDATTPHSEPSEFANVTIEPCAGIEAVDATFSSYFVEYVNSYAFDSMLQVVNTSNRNMTAQCGFEVVDSAGSIVGYIDIPCVTHRIIRPGETAWFFLFGESLSTEGVRPHTLIAHMSAKETDWQSYDLDVSDIAIGGTMYTEVVGRVTNTTGKNIDSAQVNCVFFDENGRAMDHAWTIVEDLQPGETSPFTMDAFYCDGFTSYSAWSTSVR